LVLLLRQAEVVVEVTELLHPMVATEALVAAVAVVTLQAQAELELLTKVLGVAQVLLT
jgi:hypothetical protein